MSTPPVLDTYDEERAVVCKTCHGKGVLSHPPFYTKSGPGDTCRNCGGAGYVWRVLTFVKVKAQNDTDEKGTLDT